MGMHAIASVMSSAGRANIGASALMINLFHGRVTSVLFPCSKKGAS